MPRKLAIILIGFMIFSVVIGGFSEEVHGSTYIEDYDDRDFRIAGNNRFQTAARIAKSNNSRPDTVIIVRGDSVDGVPQVVDGLTASALAGSRNAQILLVSRDHLPADTSYAIRTMNPKNAIVVGGDAAVSVAVAKEIEALGPNVTRVFGSNRFETAAKVARNIGSAKNQTAIIVNANSEVDSLVAGPLAHKGYPILMVNNTTESITDATEEAIRDLNINKLIIVGGTGVVSENLENKLNNLPGVEVEARYGGANRVETSLQLAAHDDFRATSGVSLVNGVAYVDAVGASTLGNPVVYFMEKRGITPEIQEFVDAKTALKGIGGTAIITDKQLQQVTEKLAFNHYALMHRARPDIERYKTGLIHSSMYLLDTAQTAQSKGDFNRASQIYDRILTNKDLLPENVVASTTASKIKSDRRETIEEPMKYKEDTEKLTSITTKFNAYHDGYPLYQWIPQYSDGFYDTGERLMTWALSRHNNEEYDVAMGRYSILIDKGADISALAPVVKEAEFYNQLAEQRTFLNNQKLSMKFSRYNDSLVEALNQQIMRDGHTIWSTQSFQSPGQDDVEYYLNSDNFYIRNWLENAGDTEFVIIDTTTLRMRSGASTNYDIVDTVSNGEVYEVLKESNGWVQIRKEGKTGWVSLDYVHKLGADRKITNLRLQVTASTLNVRTGPSTNNSKIGSISRNEEYSLLDHKNGWHRINYYGSEGWVHGDYVTITKELPSHSFQFLTLTDLVNVSSGEMGRILSEEPLFNGYSTIFRNAARENGINEIYLGSHALLESKSITRELVRGVQVSTVGGKSVTPKTVYNVFGIGVKGADPLKAGAEFAYEQGWTTREIAIKEGAKWIAQNYINKPTEKQDTPYKMLWDPENGGRNFFTTNVRWAKDVGVEMHRFYELLDRDEASFDISVYKTIAWPVPGHFRITSPYGMRIHPITKVPKMHIGMDVAAPGGAPIVAAKSGTVTVSHYGASYGNWVEIDHGQGITTRYAHNSKNLVKVGDWVSQGQTIALIGTTGSSTGNHIHFEVRHNNNHFDPLPWLQGR